MKRQLITAFIIVALLIAALPAGSFARAQDSAPYTLDMTLGRGAVRSLAWSPDGVMLAVGGALGIWLYSPGFEDIGLLKGHTKAVYSLAFSPDGSRLASVSHDRTVRIWDVASQTGLYMLEGHTDLVVTVAWSAANRIASGSYDGTIRLWNPDTGEALGLLGTHEGWVDEVVFSPDGSLLASVGHDGMLRVWDVESRGLVWDMLAHDGGAQAITWSPDGSRLATGGRDGILTVWDAATSDDLWSVQAHEAVIYGAAWNPQGDSVATAGWDGMIREWDVSQHALLRTITDDTGRGHTGQVYRVAWSPDGSRLATLSWDDTARVWDTATSRPIVEKSEHLDWIVWIGWDSSDLLAATIVGRVNCWRTWGGDYEMIYVAPQNPDDLPPVSETTPDGTRRFTIDPAGIVHIVDTASGARIMELPGRANVASWSPDGARLAVAMRDGTISVWSETE